jgi:hypothetical protein
MRIFSKNNPSNQRDHVDPVRLLTLNPLEYSLTIVRAATALNRSCLVTASLFVLTLLDQSRVNSPDPEETEDVNLSTANNHLPTRTLSISIPEDTLLHLRLWTCRNLISGLANLTLTTTMDSALARRLYPFCATREVGIHQK